MNRRPKELQKNIREIVDFYMLSVTDYQDEIRDGMEYYWSCMSAGTIEDYLELVRSRRNLSISNAEIEQVFRSFYGEDGVFDEYKLEFIKAVLLKAKEQTAPKPITEKELEKLKVNPN
jgi:hypothetical protein